MHPVDNSLVGAAPPLAVLAAPPGLPSLRFLARVSPLRSRASTLPVPTSSSVSSGPFLRHALLTLAGHYLDPHRALPTTLQRANSLRRHQLAGYLPAVLCPPPGKPCSRPFSKGSQEGLIMRP